MVYASRSLTSTEQCYAQIEEEALVLTWACERFEGYLLGMQSHLHTDHKPLLSILSSKSLDTRHARVQWFHMRLTRYQFSIYHVPGPPHCRYSVVGTHISEKPNDDRLRQQLDNVVHLDTKSLPIMEEVSCKSPECRMKMQCTRNSKVKGLVKLYRQVSPEICKQDGLLTRTISSSFHLSCDRRS